MKIRLLRNARVRGSMFRKGAEVNVTEAQGKVFIRKRIAEEAGGQPAPRFARGGVYEPEADESEADEPEADESEADESEADESEAESRIPLDDEGEPDREWLKGKLDDLGVDFNPRSHTPTLVELYEQHR